MLSTVLLGHFEAYIMWTLLGAMSDGQFQHSQMSLGSYSQFRMAVLTESQIKDEPLSSRKWSFPRTGAVKTTVDTINHREAPGAQNAEGKKGGREWGLPNGDGGWRGSGDWRQALRLTVDPVNPQVCYLPAGPVTIICYYLQPHLWHAGFPHTHTHTHHLVNSTCWSWQGLAPWMLGKSELG